MHEVAFSSLSRLNKGMSSEQVIQAAAALPLLLLAVWLGRAWLRPLTFDDAYMFYRYAVNMRDGLGIVWNRGGEPTYGMTSQLWGFIVLPFTMLPLSMAHALQLASWLAGIASLATLSIGLARRAESRLLRLAPAAFAAVAAPLLVNPIFAYHLTTGMDTMLSLLANSIVIVLVLAYRAAPAVGKSMLIGMAGTVAVLARPDAGLCAFGAPLLVWVSLPGSRRWSDLAGLCVLPAALIAGDLLLCNWYFHVPLPLGFYAKAVHIHAGFTNHENAVQYAYMAGLCVLPFIAVSALTLRRQNVSLLVAFMLPAAVTVLYLLTVRQVMGFVGRYYIPLVPFVAVPALLSADAALVRHAFPSMRRLGIAFAVTALAYVGLRPAELMLEKAYTERTVPAPIAVPSLIVPADSPLPAYGQWYPMTPVLGELISALPPGATVAATEVGYIAAVAPRASIIDLVGLNDTQIGLHGFSMDRFLARAPDLIWLPQSDYTALRSMMLRDPRLYNRYTIVADMFDFGIAIRRDSRMRAEIETGVRRAWSVLYPRYSLAQYTVPDSYEPTRQ